MAEALKFSLVSPERELFSGEAQSVRVPGTEGAFEVMAGHAPFMTTLSPGLLVINQAGGEERFFVRGGFADVSTGGLTVLAEVALAEGELKGDNLSVEKNRASRLMKSDDPDTSLDASRAADVLAAY